MTITISALKKMSTAQIKSFLNQYGSVTVTSGGLPIMGIRSLTIPPDPTTKKLYLSLDAQVNRFLTDYPEFKAIADQPQAVWLGEWSGDVEAEARKHSQRAKNQGAVPVFVVYMIPGLDMGGYSGGGSKTPEGYCSWIDKLAAGLVTESIIVLEPDALVHDMSDSSATAIRLELLRYALDKLKAHRVYLDAGHPRWHHYQETARRLNEVGLGNAAGFALNVSNFVTTDMCLKYGAEISGLVNGKHFIIDTSRNGNPDMPEPWDWANPPKARLGLKPTLETKQTFCDGFLWIKAPGESDGWAGADPSPAGEFRPKLALSLLGKL